jgi:hypothetical protein
MISIPEINEEEINSDEKNCLRIGLKFPDYNNNNFQKTFIQQLKRKNTINEYFWIMIFHDNESNRDYDGAFIFGDILNDFYPTIFNISYSRDKLVHTYTGSRRKNNNITTNNVLLEWGLQFDEIYYENSTNNESSTNEKNIVYIKNTITSFNFEINAIFSTFEYSRNIQKDFFNYYFNENICKPTFMRNSLYKFIYCKASNFTQKDLEKFPPLNFKNRILRFIFTLDYKDLFSLTNDKKYYIFKIMIVNVYSGNEDGGQWVLGLPFWKKYQFSFDTDNKLIYFYNKDGNFLDELSEDEYEYNDNKEETKDKTKNNDEDKNKIDSDISNNKTNDSKNDNSQKYINIEIKTLVLLIILIIVFICLLVFLIIILIKKILFKKGFVLKRIKKANELNDDEFDYSSNNKSNSKKR